MPGPVNDKGRKRRQNKKQKTKKNEPSAFPDSTSPTADAADHLPLDVQSPPETVSHAAETSRRADSMPVKYPHAPSRHEREEYPTVEEDNRPDSDYNQKPTRNTHGAAAAAAVYTGNGKHEEKEEEEDVDPEVEHLESSSSYIYDPGNGPRVRDFLAFLKSPFAAPQSQSFLVVGRDTETGHDEAAAMAAGDEGYPAVSVIPIVNRFLPGEFATILWFNRTRKTQRICPACTRLYHLGDDLPPLIARAEGLAAQDADPVTRRMEQYLSGICSFPCFALATYNYGPAAVWAYALPLNELDEDTREAIEGEGSGVDDKGLSTYVRMTRYDGEGLMALLSGAI